MSNTLTMEVPAGTINPVTGHVDADDAALFRAIGPDQPDPPSISGTERTTHIPFGWIRPQGGGMPEPEDTYTEEEVHQEEVHQWRTIRSTRRTIRSTRRRSTRRRPTGRRTSSTYSPSPSYWRGGRSDKLVGNTPLIFKGERSRAEEFITQWQLYEGVNITNDLMRNAYQRAMLFLTYIQGPIVNEWVKGVNAWLRGQIIHQRWAPTDERLWVEVFDSFNRQFANVMEQEDAQAALAKGLQLERGDLDKLVTEFEQLVRHAGYDINQDLVLRIFTSALPNSMYEYILRTLPQPATYEQWRTAAIDQQRVYVHMREQSRSFQNKENATHYHLEAVRQPMEEPPT
jgi:hypothetical protein